MISKILVFSRAQVTNGIQLFKDQNIGIISIISFPTDVLLTWEFRSLKHIEHKPHLTLCFEDMTLTEWNAITDIPTKESKFLFNSDHARAITEFVEKHKNDLDTLIIHCDAGESRSGAVGIWASRYLEIDPNDKLFWINNRQVQPNSYVLNVLYEVSGLRKRIEENLKFTFNRRVQGDRRKEDPNG